MENKEFNYERAYTQTLQVVSEIGKRLEEEKNNCKTAFEHIENKARIELHSSICRALEQIRQANVVKNDDKDSKAGAKKDE